MKKWKDNVYFILVGPRESGNIGASARAIKNMGFRQLCIVGTQTDISAEARWFAHGALDVLESMQVYDSLEEALSDKQLVVGTTRRKGRRRGVILPVEQGVRRVFETAAQNKVAILFGREDRGLYNDEVAECGFLLAIPTGKEQPSLNLSQAVLLTAYELLRAENVPKLKSGFPAGRKPVTHEELGFLFERIAETMKVIEYMPRGDRDLEKKIMSNLKHFIGRAGLTDWELKMLHGICSQIGRKIG